MLEFLKCRTSLAMDEEASENKQKERNAFRSYKDKLVGVIPGAYEKAFGFASNMDEGVESDGEEDSLCEGMVAISLFKEEKARIREP